MSEELERQATNFSIDRLAKTNKLRAIYADEPAAKRKLNRKPSYSTSTYENAAEVYAALSDSISDTNNVVELSKKLYSTNPIYASVIDYLANMFLWRYKITPHKVYTKSKAKLKKELKEDDFALIYNLMLEVTEGLSIETKFPSLLTLLFTTGSVYFTTFCDEDSLTIDTILLPTKYCRKVGETQYGTAIVQFDFSYFKQLGMTEEQLKDFLKGFPQEFTKGYNRYKKDSSNEGRWQVLDPAFTSGIMLNEIGIPTYLYLYAGIINYEKYEDNELERNENLLKYIVVQTMPHYEDKLIFEVDEVQALHQSMRKIVDSGNKARLITTFGDIHVDRIGDTSTAENEALLKSFKAIFNNAGLNAGMFTSESVEALKMSYVRDRDRVWKYIQQLLSFYTITVNNWFDFKTYQADIDILPISEYTYNDDMDKYKENATLGVGKLDYFIASGIKQKNIQDQLNLEKFLKLDTIVPMQTSYTQTADDRSSIGSSKDDETDKSSNKDVKSANEPADENKEVSKKDDALDKSNNNSDEE